MIQSHYFEIVGFFYFLNLIYSLFLKTKTNMKNYLFLGMMSTVIIFNSCSNGDDNTNDSSEKKLLLSKVTTTYMGIPDNVETGILTFEYNNKGQLVKMQSKDGATTFEYNNNKPVKSNYYNSQQKLEYYSEFSYDGNQLIGNKVVSPTPQNNITYKYTYALNGQLATSTICNSVNCTSPTIEYYTYNGDNVSVYTVNIGETNFSLKNEYSSDNKFTPYTNINKYLKIFFRRTETLSKNNYLTDKNSSNSSGNWLPNDTITYTLEYNSSGFPIKSLGKNQNGKSIVQYDYEYIIQ